MSAPSMVIPIPTITIGGPGSPIRPLRTTFGPARRSEDLKMRFFFDSLVHMPFPPPNEDENRTYLRPRLIYVRDFDYLAPHASVWYPHLLAAVRELRQGGASGSKVANSIVVVFGVSAELDTYSEPSATSESGKNTPGSPTVKKVSLEQEAPNELFLDLSLNDEEFGDRIREKRLQSWLRHWEAHGDDAIRDALPWFSVSEASELRGRVARVTSVPGEGMKVISGDAMDLPEPVARFLRMVKRASEGQDQDQEKSPYFNVATAIPAVRNPEAEGAARLLRREELNWLAFRMALKRLGGSVSPGALSQYPHYGHRVPDATEETTKWKDRCKDVMDVEWERSLVDFDRLQEVAKRAMGLVMVEKGSQENGSILESQDQHTKMSWHDVSFAWHAIKEIEYERKAWVSSQRQHMGDRRSAFTSQEALPETDEVVERVKADPNLDPHEKRLLGCIVDPTSMPTTFASVHLPEKTIDAIRTMISLPLLYPKAFEQGVLKNHSMNGALLLGPPGVGKTLLARAVARESGARMLMVKPSDVMDMYVGEGEKLVRSVFSLARRLSPCVVFLDEVDALFASRVSSRDSGGAIAHRSVITEFMQEMDGLKTNKSQGSVIVVGATNRPFDLDDAVLRRLPRRLLIDLPGEKDRLEILKIHLRGEVISPLLDLKALAKRTEMYSGSDLKNLVVAAALDAVKERVDLPWSTEHKHTFKASATSPISQIDEPREPQSSLADFRILEPQHFDKAMEEITPSSSEHLGTLHELRKWNEEFGEGRAKNGGRKTRWGEKFGFGGKDGDHLDGRVMKESPQPPP
ncbi:hypothetical protein FRB99_002444 [Tulasnella sp. 403]|nr:hypothetical protein FRB99_002444 [Tulasnella sp. 403]